jgi:hypothetical protein
MPSYNCKRFVQFSWRVVAMIAMSAFGYGFGVCSAQGPGADLPAPQRPGTENGLNPLTPHESEIPHRVTDITLQQAALTGPPPADLSTKLFSPAADPNTQRTRGWGATEYSWVPTCIAYHPLYFQQVSLERYGQTYCPCLQPVISSGQFFGTALALPGLMVLDWPCDCLYAYGYASPGSPCQ